MSGCDIECLSMKVVDGSLPLNVRLDAGHATLELLQSGFKLSEAASHSLEEQLVLSHSSFASLERVSGVVDVISEILKYSLVPLGEAAMASISSLLNDKTLKVSTKENLAYGLARSLSLTGAVPDQVLSEISKCALSFKAVGAAHMCSDIFVNIVQRAEVSSDVMRALKDALHYKTTASIAAGVLASYTLEPNHKVPIAILVELAELIRSSATNQSTKYSAALVILRSIVQQGPKSHADLETALVGITFDKLVSRSFDVVLAALKSKANSKSFQLSRESAIRVAEQALAVKVTRDIALDVLKQIDTLPESTLVSLGQLVLSNYPMSLRRKAAMTLKLHIVDGSANAWHEGLEAGFDSGDAVLEEALTEIFISLSVATKLAAGAIAHFEGMLGARGCMEFFEVADVDEHGRELNIERLCVHDESNTAGWIDSKGKIDRSQVHTLSVILGNQVVTHEAQLNVNSVKALIALVNGQGLHDPTRANLLVMIRRLIGSSDAVTQELAFLALSRFVANKNQDVDVRNVAAAVIVKLAISGRGTAEGFLSIEAAARDSQNADLSKHLLVALGFIARQARHIPHSSLLVGFESLMLHKDYFLPALYGVCAILKQSGTLVHASVKRLTDALEAPDIASSTKEVVISVLGNHFLHAKLPLTASVLEALEVEMDSGITTNMFNAFLVHVQNRGKLNEFLVDRLLSFSQKDQVLSLLHELSKTSSIKSTKALKLLAHYLVTPIIAVRDRDRALSALKSSQALPGLTAQEGFAKCAPNCSMSTALALAKAAAENYELLSWNFLIKLGELVDSTRYVQDISAILRQVLMNGQVVPQSLMQSILAHATAHSSFHSVEVLTKIAEVNSDARAVVFKILAARAVESESIDIKLISGLSKLISYTPVIEGTLLVSLLSKSKAAEELMAVVQLLGIVAKRGMSLPEVVFVRLRQLLVSGIASLREAVLAVYAKVSERQVVSSDDVAALVNLLGNGTLEAEVLEILQNLSERHGLNASEFATCDVARNIFAFKNEPNIENKVAAVKTLSDLITTDNAQVLIGIFRQGLLLKDRRLTSAIVDALERISRLVAININEAKAALINGSQAKERAICVMKIPNTTQAYADIQGSESDQFLMNLQRLETIRRDAGSVLNASIIWQQSQNYTLYEAGRVLEMMSRTSNFEVEAVCGSLEDVEQAWLEAKIEEALPYAIIDQTILLQLQKWMASFSTSLKANIFDNIKDLHSLRDIEELFGFVTKHSITRDSLAAALVDGIELRELYLVLSTNVLSTAFKRTFETIEAGSMLPVFRQLLESGWKLSSVLKLIEIVDSENHDEFIRSLTLISAYRIPEHATDKSELTAAKILENQEPANWYLALTQLATQHHFERYSGDLDDQALFKELALINKDNDVASASLKWVEFQLKAIREAESDESKIFSSLHRDRIPNVILQPYPPRWPYPTIHTWSAQDISQWRQVLKPEQVKHNMSEILAVISRAVFLVYGYSPRAVQLISALILNHSPSGMLAEISTGEGKSLIVAIIAISKVLEGHKVDIVTSSPVLAKRDAEEQAALYQIFGITVADNTKQPGRSEEERRASYEQDIVYGDIVNFIGDILSQEYHGEQTRGTRGFGYVIVDEVDSMLIDESKHVVKLSEQIPSFAYLEPLLAATWHQLLMLNERIKYDEKTDQHFFSLNDGDEDELVQIPNVRSFQEAVLEDYLTQIVDAEPGASHDSILIPSHLKDFVRESIHGWSSAAVSASRYQEKVNYIVADEDGVKTVMPVDFRSTGVIQRNMHWHNGLHQFLQIKHGLRISPESLSLVYMSNIGFFKKYGQRIYGMTGTLGAKSEQALLHGIYGVDFVSVPTYKKKKFVEWPVLIAHGSQDWLLKVVHNVLTEVQRGRAVLVISETIKDVELIVSLLARYVPAGKIHTYTQGDESTVRARMDSGDIIIATNLAGRGTDLKTSEKLQAHGGLHVLVTYLPMNCRVQGQLYGRTSRQGQIGTAQVIFDIQYEMAGLQHSYPWFENEETNLDTRAILKWRDLAENERLLVDTLISIDMTSLQDDLFADFLEFVRDLKANRQAGPNEIAQIGELWGMWREKQGKLIDAHTVDQKIETADLEAIKKKNSEIRAKIQESFIKFKQNITLAFNADTLIVNPSYLVKRAQGREGDDDNRINNIIDLLRAIALDPQYSFAAHYAMARLDIKSHLSSNEEKASTCKSLSDAKQSALAMIDQLHGMHVLLTLQSITNQTSALTNQTAQKVAIFETLVGYIESKINFIQSSGYKERIALSKDVPLKTLFPNSEAEVSELETIGLTDFFEIYKYTPRPKKKWWKTIGSMLLGIFYVVVGSLVVIGTGGLGAGLIPTTLTGAIGLAVAVDGIADILNSVIAFATGRPIMDLDAHFKSKGIGYAITAITMGLQSIYGKLAEKFPKLAKYQAAWTKPGAGKALDAAGKELSKQAIKESVIGAIKEQFVKQGLIKTFTYLASAAGGSILKDYRQEVEDGVSKEITALIKSLQAELDKILSDDAWHHTRARQAELHFEAVRILERSQEGYRSAGLEIASGVASNLVPGAKIMIEGIKLAESLEKVLALTRQFTHVFRQVIQMRASDVQPNTFMLVDIMQKSKRLSEGNIASILKTLTSSRILVENAVSCGVTDCAKIMDMTGLTVPSQHVVNKACMDVYKVVCADYADRRIALREELVDRITDTIIHLIQGELINPVSGLGVSYGVNTIFDRLKAAKTGLEEDAAKAQQAKQPPAPLKKARLRTGATTPSAGLIETEVLAHTNKLKVPIEIYRDGKFAKLLGAEHSHFLRTPIKVNYNTLTRMWTMPGDPNYVGTDSVFEVIGRQTLHLRTPQTPAQLREFVTDYTNKHPEFTREAMLKRFHDIINGLDSSNQPASNIDSATEAGRSFKRQPYDFGSLFTQAERPAENKMTKAQTTGEFKYGMEVFHARDIDETGKLKGGVNPGHIGARLFITDANDELIEEQFYGKNPTTDNRPITGDSRIDGAQYRFLAQHINKERDSYKRNMENPDFKSTSSFQSYTRSLTAEQHANAIAAAIHPNELTNPYVLSHDDCISYAQRIYKAAGQPVDILYGFKQANTIALADMGRRFGAQIDGSRVVQGLSKEHVARENRISSERVRELLPRGVNSLAPNPKDLLPDFIILPDDDETKKKTEGI